MPYISVGGVVGDKGNQGIKDKFLRYVFYHTRDKVRVHGLGITGRKTLEHYPFYSVDSSSWILPARFGRSKFVARGDKAMQKYRATKADRYAVCEHEIRGYLKLEYEMTEHWKARGVVWEK